MVTGSQELSRRINRRHILRAIRRHEPVSRTEVANITGLAGGTLTAVTNELLEEGLVTEARSEGGSVRGRPRMLLRLNPRAALVVGVYVFPFRRILFEVVDLRGETIALREDAETVRGSVADLIEMIDRGVRLVVADAGLVLDDIHSVGVALPAIVESDAGLVHWLREAERGPHPLAMELSARLGAQVRLENTANVAALAERWFGNGRDVDDFAVVIVGHGVGLGQFVQGELWRGAHGMNSEIGHMKVPVADPQPCVCGAKGCLVRHAGVGGLIDQAAAAAGDIPPRTFGPRQRIFEGLLAQAAAREPAATRLFETAGAAMGIALANLANLTDPSRIIVSYESADMAALVSPTLRSTFTKELLAPLRDRVDLQMRQDALRWSQGAAAIALEDIYGAMHLD